MMPRPLFMMKVFFVAASLIAVLYQSALANGITIVAILDHLSEPYFQGPQIELLLESYKGQKLGYDRKSATVIEAMGEGSGYFDEGDEDLRAKHLEVVNDPLEGLYTLSIIGTQTGIFGVDVCVVEPKAILSEVIYGLIGKGDILQVEIIYAGNLQEPSSISRKVTLDAIKKELRIAFDKSLVGLDLKKTLTNSLDEIDKSLRRHQNNSARDTIYKASSLLKEKHKKYGIKDMQDVEYWFPKESIALMQKANETNRLFDKELFSLENVKPERKKEWLAAKAIEILYTDLDTFGEAIK